MITISGWFSSICFAICGIPQALLCIKTKSSKGISWFFIILWILGEIFGSIYAIGIDSPSLLFNYIISFVCACIIIWYKIFGD